jgi:hypothetical protein
MGALLLWAPNVMKEVTWQPERCVGSGLLNGYLALSVRVGGVRSAAGLARVTDLTLFTMNGSCAVLESNMDSRPQQRGDIVSYHWSLTFRHYAAARSRLYRPRFEPQQQLEKAAVQSIAERRGATKERSALRARSDGAAVCGYFGALVRSLGADSIAHVALVGAL